MNTLLFGQKLNVFGKEVRIENLQSSEQALDAITREEISQFFFSGEHVNANN